MSRYPHTYSIVAEGKHLIAIIWVVRCLNILRHYMNQSLEQPYIPTSVCGSNILVMAVHKCMAYQSNPEEVGHSICYKVIIDFVM